MANVGNAFGSAGTGAAVGAGLGTIIPGVGNVVGGVVGGALGFLGGLFGGGTDESWIEAQGPSGEENRATRIEQNALWQMNDLVGAGPGMQDVQRNLASQRGLAAMLQQYAQSGGLPSNEDINTANGLAANLFQARRTALNQNFQDQLIASNQEAARLGRTPNDPILRAKMLTNQSRMLSSLDAEQSGFGTQLALGLADKRVGFAQGAANVDAALAAQAQSNRAALLGLGSQVAGRYSNYRLATAKRFGEHNGSVGDAIGGGLAGLGAGMNIASMFGGGSFNAGVSGLPTTNVTARTGFGGANGIEMPAFQSSPGVRNYALGNASMYG